MHNKEQINIPSGARPWQKFLAFFGPGLLIAVGYIDPGNWATDLSAGAKYGYALLFVIVLSNLFAILFQYLALKLGIVTGRDLAQACRDRFPRPVNVSLWLLCEVAIISCDLAEVIGSAIALNLLFGIPLVVGIAITALDVFIVLGLQAKGFRYLEALVGGLMFIIGAAFVYELVMAHPVWGGVAAGFIPTPQVVMDPSMLYVAIGIIGATVMPHNLYLHSSIVQTRAFVRDDEGKSMAVKYATIDIMTALTIAIFINAAILILSAAAFHGTGHQDIADIGDAYKLLAPTLGASLASIVFGVALLAAGQSSTLTGTLAGHIVMEGFLNIRLTPWVRRIITRMVAVIPAVCVAVWVGPRGVGQLLIFSQVILSFQLAFAVVPLVMFTSDRQQMGRFTNSLWLKIAGWLAAVIIILLNLFLIGQVVAICTGRS